MIYILKENEKRKITNIIKYLTNNNIKFLDYYYYSKTTNNINDFKQYNEIISFFDWNITKLKLFFIFINTLYTFFWKTKVIKTFKSKWNFKNKLQNVLFLEDIEKYIVRTKNKEIIINKKEKYKNSIMQKIIYLNKNIFNNIIIQNIIIEIIKIWKINQDNFYYLLKDKI